MQNDTSELATYFHISQVYDLIMHILATAVDMLFPILSILASDSATLRKGRTEKDGVAQNSTTTPTSVGHAKKPILGKGKLQDLKLLD